MRNEVLNGFNSSELYMQMNVNRTVPLMHEVRNRVEDSY